MKTALIVGCKGQDGLIACQMLSQKGYRIIGIDIGVVHGGDIVWDRDSKITHKDDVFNLLRSSRPDEIYYLAAFHQSSQDHMDDEIGLLNKSLEVNVLGLGLFLEGIKNLGLATKLFYASSSLIFEGTTTDIQDENTPFCPQSIYGMTKLDGLLLCRFYRQSHGVFASSGILYNHESFYRQENFISKKIIKAAVEIKQGRQGVLTVGDLNAEVDWGYAPDYVEAMQRILNISKADEFVIASGKKHSVQDFIEIAFNSLGMDWKEHVREDTGIVTRKRKALVGDSGKLKSLTGWNSTVDFEGMIKLLCTMERS